MNLHTFKDVVSSKRQALVNDLDEDEDEDDIGKISEEVDGEEEEGADKFNEVGEVIEPFNLRNERDGGHFDSNMNYVWSKEKQEPDAWLANLDEAEMEKSIGEAMKALKKKNQEEGSTEIGPTKSEKDLKIELLNILQRNENVLLALRRLGGKSAPVAKKRGVVSKSSAEVTAMNRLTEIADALVGAGLTGVYNMSREAIDASMVMWEYRGLDGAIHGPYSSQQIADWKNQGFFSASSAVMMRRVLDTTAVSGSLKRGNQSVSEAIDEKNKRIRFEDDDDLMKDLDEDDEVVDPHHFPTSSSLPSEPWISSEEVDFGEFVTLPEHEQQDDDEDDEGAG